jgi:hypothetical protein
MKAERQSASGTVSAPGSISTKHLGIRAESEESNKVGNNPTGDSDVSFGSAGVVYKH